MREKWLAFVLVLAVCVALVGISFVDVQASKEKGNTETMLKFSTTFNVRTSMEGEEIMLSRVSNLQQR